MQSEAMTSLVELLQTTFTDKYCIKSTENLTLLLLSMGHLHDDVISQICITKIAAKCILVVVVK